MSQLRYHRKSQAAPPLRAWAAVLALLLGIGAGVAAGQSEPATKDKDGKPKPVEVPDMVVEQPPQDAVNLLPNGDLEQAAPGGDYPLHWQGVDNLVWFWTADPADPARGKVIKVDTDVEQSQAYDWWVQRFVRNSPLSAAPTKIPGQGEKYGSVAGLEGGFYVSDLIPVKKGGAYKVYIDAKGPASMVFLFGYVKDEPVSFGDEKPAVQQVFRKARGEPETTATGRPVRYRLRYLYRTWFAVGGNEKWQTYTHRMPRHPNNREITEDVRFLRIQIYPFWPPGEYWYDNVKVIEVQDDSPGKPDASAAEYEEGKVIR